MNEIIRKVGICAPRQKVYNFIGACVFSGVSNESVEGKYRSVEELPRKRLTLHLSKISVFGFVAACRAFYEFQKLA